MRSTSAMARHVCLSFQRTQRTQARFIAQIEQQHQAGGNGKESVQKPHRSKRKADDVQPVNHVAEITQR